MAAQCEDGMVPHIIFHKPDPGCFPGPDVWQTGQTPPTCGITQPPVAAILTRVIREQDRAAGQAHMASLYPRLVEWHCWWHQMRCTHGPAAITHPWDSGRDNCPDRDIGMADVDGSKAGACTRRDTGHVDASMRPSKAEYDRYIAMFQFGVAVGRDPARIVAFAGVLGSGAFLAYLADAARSELDANLLRVWDAAHYGIPSVDRIVVLDFGRIAQVGSLRELYERPAHLFVAQVIGSPHMNVMPARAVSGASVPATAVSLGIRPGHIAPVAPGAGQLRGTVDVAEYLGADTFVIIACGDAGQVTVRVTGDSAPGPGAPVGLSVPSESIHCFDEVGQAIS